ncbi:hypothetical protein PR048_028226 [Dryococelus australis]|uniref:Uncharacterized protein n=1 Tax=Dryococelus australis TaxID=614101 RepID=A0ABQ9GIP7_9NEOP|nr:hypothetical protein PR048_028226 [Dryococelus australis]
MHSFRFRQVQVLRVEVYPHREDVTCCYLQQTALQPNSFHTHNADVWVNENPHGTRSHAYQEQSRSMCGWVWCTVT